MPVLGQVEEIHRIVASPRHISGVGLRYIKMVHDHLSVTLVCRAASWEPPRRASYIENRIDHPNEIPIIS